MPEKKKAREYLGDDKVKQIPIVRAIGGYIDAHGVADMLGITPREAHNRMVYMNPIMYRDRIWVLKSKVDTYIEKQRSVTGLIKCVDFAREVGYNVKNFVTNFQRCGYDVVRFGAFTYAKRADLESFVKEWKYTPNKPLVRFEDIPDGYYSTAEIMSLYGDVFAYKKWFLRTERYQKSAKIRSVKVHGKRYYCAKDFKKFFEREKLLNEEYLTTSQICLKIPSITRAMVLKLIRSKRLDAITEGGAYYVKKEDVERLAESWNVYATESRKIGSAGRRKFGVSK